jgi:HK97 family phage major capsid protein/HK97 family phage prohead protease
MLNRAYSLLDIKSVSDEQRIITGTATTPTPDRVGDIVEPLGVKFKNPMPLLWQHRSDAPVGTVKFDKPTKDGITFQAKLPKIDEPGPLKDRVDTAWGEVKTGLVRAVSIGFRSIEYSRMEDGGLRFIESEVLELSLVTIPAQAEATIQTIKSIDAEQLAIVEKAASLNSSGVAYANSLITRGNVNTTAAWSFSAEDGNKLLGPKGDDWPNYGRHHLGVDSGEAENTKAHWKYPFAKGSVIFRSALTAIRQRAGQQNDTGVFDAAGALIKRIDSKKDIDAHGLAAPGQKPNGSDSTPAGVTASRATVKVMETRTMAKKSIAEQISAFEATRAAKAARMDEIMDAAAEKGETLDAAAKEEFDGLAGEVKEIDEHLVRLRAREKENKAAAVEVKGETQDEAGKSRGGVRVESVRANLPKGIPFARYAMALAASKGNLMQAYEMAKSNQIWHDQTPEIETVLKAAVAAGTTTDSSWAGPLVQYQVLTQDFIEFLRGRTIIGRIPGLRRVPFKVKVQRQTAVASVGWVGEGKPKPVSRGSFDTVTLDITKIAGIVVLTEELIRLSNPSAEQLVRDDLANGVIELMDNDFIDPDKAAVSNTSPASLTNGVTPVVATGTAFSNLAADVKSVFANFDAANIESGIVVVMKTGLARSLGLMLNALGQNVFPNLGADGGTFLGMPAITSTNVPYTEDSPQEGSPIIFIAAPEIMLADDGGVTIDVSREASVQMDSAPDDPVTASTVHVSLWQENKVGIRAERMINWVKRRSAAVQYISAAKYA